MIKMLMFDTKNSEKEFLKTCDTSDFEITLFKENLTKDTKLTLKEFDETTIISIFLTSKITKEVLDKFKNLRIIVTRSKCYNHIDLEACRSRNIAVINTTNYGSESVAQYVMGLISAMTRNIFSAVFDLKKGMIDFEKYECRELNKFSVGVIGTGNTGSAVCRLAHKSGMTVFAHDIKINEEISSFTDYLSFNDLLRKSDIITLHIPYIKECCNMFSYNEFALMKEGSYFINTSQGDFINYTALYNALKTQKLKGAALDILIDVQKELFLNKKPSYEELEKAFIYEKLVSENNVIITPRIAYDTKEVLFKIMEISFNNIKDYFKGRRSNCIL